MSRDVVLLVEDNPDDAALALRAARHCPANPEIVRANDGSEALDYLFAAGAYAGRDPKQLPALVIMDLKLPKIDGLETLRRIRAHPLTATVPVVVFSSSKEVRDVRAAYAVGANGYVCKPVEFARFQDALTALLHYWLTFNERASPAC